MCPVAQESFFGSTQNRPFFRGRKRVEEILFLLMALPARFRTSNWNEQYWNAWSHSLTAIYPLKASMAPVRDSREETLAKNAAQEFWCQWLVFAMAGMFCPKLLVEKWVYGPAWLSRVQSALKKYMPAPTRNSIRASSNTCVEFRQRRFCTMNNDPCCVFQKPAPCWCSRCGIKSIFFVYSQFGDETPMCHLGKPVPTPWLCAWFHQPWWFVHHCTEGNNKVARLSDIYCSSLNNHSAQGRAG